ncbi:hypothetical protein LLG46_02770 [bacterium]|nr:hypothetical protein [bacterium]
MLDQFKNPPARYRTIAFDATDKPLLMREVKIEFDRMMVEANLPASLKLPAAIGSTSPYFRLFMDYATRVRYALSLGRRKAQIALMRPSTQQRSDFFEFYDSNLPMEHVSHDVIDEDAIVGATVVDQSLICSYSRYEMLIMPPMDAIRYETALKIQEFVDDGGQVMAAMPVPTRDSQGKKHAEVESIFAEIFKSKSCEREPVVQTNNGAILIKTYNPHELEDVLRNCICMAIKPEVSIKSDGRQCRDITFVHRTCKEAEIFFFANSSTTAHQVQLSIRCDKAPHILDPETGEQIALTNCTQQGNRTILLHNFEGCGSLLLYFDDEPSLAVPTPQSEYGQQITIPDDWNIDDDHIDTVVYSRNVLIPEFLRGQRVIIKVDDQPDIVEFIINGAAAGTRLWPPYEMDITALVKPGINEITLKVMAALRPLGNTSINIY